MDAVVTVLRGVTFCVRELLQVSNAVILVVSHVAQCVGAVILPAGW